MNLLKKCTKMKNAFAIGFLIIVGNISWGQIPVDEYHYYTLSEINNVNPDTIYALDLSKQRLSELPSELQKFKNIRGLKLSRNKLTNLPEFFTEFKQIEFLYLNKNKLNHFPSVIFHLSDLVYLDISKNKMISIPAGIKNLKKLKYLDVWDNRFTSIDPAFAELQQLEFIDFRGTTFGTSFVEKWTLAFPNGVVKFDNPCNCLD